MNVKIYELLKGWARVPTWYTGHPADNRRFDSAISTLIEEFGREVNPEDIRDALFRFRKEAPELLGGKPSDEKIEELVEKVMTALI
jgi:hypothetical protein